MRGCPMNRRCFVRYDCCVAIRQNVDKRPENIGNGFGNTRCSEMACEQCILPPLLISWFSSLLYPGTLCLFRPERKAPEIAETVRHASGPMKIKLHFPVFSISSKECNWHRNEVPYFPYGFIPFKFYPVSDLPH